ncbi:MAG: hypothetical protein COB56_06600 [Robiginitomaculum sp.]|nr:MAG: hypothetical protein COB56_06600 [Robiginitomaculum sp.]
MFTKLFLIAAVGTGALGTGAATGFTPTGVEFAAGPVRVEAGNGNFLTAHMAEHTSLTLTINLQDDRKLQLKF